MSSMCQVLQQRFFDAMLEVNPQQTRFGVKRSKTGTELPADRTLLAVELQAQQDRQAGLVAKQQFLEFTQAHLHDQVAEELFLKLGKIDTVLNTVFSLAEGFPLVLDTLSAKAVTLSQLEQCISKVEWLKEDILKVANQPQYKKKISSGNYVKELKTALGMLGIESLQQMIPLLALKRCLPHSTDPFTGFKSNIWDYSLSIAIASQRLAQEGGHNPFVAFCAGLFQSLGYFVVTRTYLRTYAQIKQSALLQARDARDTVLTDALDSLDADASFLTSCFQEFSAIISADLVSKWQLRRLPLGQILDQLAEGLSYQRATDLTRLVQQAEYFTQSQWLRKAKLLTEAEDQLWREQVQLRTEYLQILQNTRLDRLTLD